MPESKKNKGKQELKKLRLGRPKNKVTMGIVGLPNVGKSTLFNTLSDLQVAAENFPFCTIDPATTLVPVTDPRMDYLVEVAKPKAVIPAVLTVTDIAGLVKGAHEGKGLGNAFLSNIGAVDGIFHVVRAFKAKKIEHVEGSVDPVRDLEIISNELRMKDLAACNKRLPDLRKIVARNIDKTKKKDLACLEKVVELLEAGKDVRDGDWDPDEVAYLNEILFLTAKPVVYLVNVSEKDFFSGKNKHFGPIKEWVQSHGDGTGKIIPFSGDVETQLKAMAPDELKTFCDEKKTRSMIPRIVDAGYQCLGLIHYFTMGPKEVRAWTCLEGSTAPQAAGVIHGDFQTHFIKADVMHYDDLKANGDEQATKAAGKLMTKGKDYIVEDGDIMLFKHNA